MYNQNNLRFHYFSSEKFRKNDPRRKVEIKKNFISKVRE